MCFLSDNTLSCLSGLAMLVSGTRGVANAFVERRFLVVPIACTSTMQNHASSVISPKLWNGLPREQRLSLNRVLISFRVI